MSFIGNQYQMKYIILTIVLLYGVTLTGCRSHKITVPDNMKKVRTEIYDFHTTKGGTQDVTFAQNGWLIEKNKMDSTGAFYNEYAPAAGFYKIYKSFHPNGMIKERGKYLGLVRFGIWETFDETGNRIQAISEDTKFGAIGPREIVDFLQKEGWFDSSTGEHMIYKVKERLTTDGDFYRQLIRVIWIRFISDTTNKENDIESSVWNIKINLGGGSESYGIEYNINTHTEKIERIDREGLIFY